MARHYYKTTNNCGLKSQAKNVRVDKKDYLEDQFHESYKIQMEFMLTCSRGWVQCSSNILFSSLQSKRDEDEFNKTMRFDEYLVPYKWINDWIESRLDEMVGLMNLSEIPESNPSCKNCAYAIQYAKIYFQEIQVKKK